MMWPSPRGYTLPAPAEEEEAACWAASSSSKMVVVPGRMWLVGVEPPRTTYSNREHTHVHTHALTHIHTHVRMIERAVVTRTEGR